MNLKSLNLGKWNELIDFKFFLILDTQSGQSSNKIRIVESYKIHFKMVHDLGSEWTYALALKCIM